MNYIKYLLTLMCLSSTICLLGQFNPADPNNIAMIGGIVSASTNSPFEISKQIATNEAELRDVAGLNYKVAHFNGADFAVFEKSNGKREAFQLLAIDTHFTLLCEHYVEEVCDCFEGLHILANASDMPVRVRKVWPFSLKENLKDEISAASLQDFSVGNFNTVCDILRYFERP